MPSWYKTKKVALQYKDETVERVVAHDLDRVYITDRQGDISVYYDSDIIVDNKHLFVLGKTDDTVKVAKSNSFVKGRDG